MRDFARLPEKDRRDVFRAVAQRMRVHEAIVEKDFWVCWVLDWLFQASTWKDRLAFKGGTSLSKAYGAIQRFSEDIDLIIDWRVLGYEAEEPNEPRSVTKQQAFADDANRRAVGFLADDLVPSMGPWLSERAGRELKVEARDQEVLIYYPGAFSLAAIQPMVRLEVGPIAAWTPNERRAISPYAAEQFPKLFTVPSTEVPTIAAERTFWEKATILHQEAHRGADKPLPPRYSRHYYDLYRLSLLPVRAKALSRMDLLQDVVEFKSRFYRCPWARYEEARPGTLRLLPPVHHEAGLRRDYESMKQMLFGDIPSFDDIVKGLQALEDDVNKMENAAQ